MLQAQGVAVNRGGRCVLQNVSLALQPGQVLGVLGPNGAGKSSLLGVLNGELAASSGQILLDAQPLTSWQGRQRAQRLAVLPQSSALNFAFSVEQVVHMGRMPHDTGRVLDQQIVDAVLRAVDAGHLAGRSYLQLSGGERQRVHLARVLAQLWPGADGQVLLLDEPTSMLDPLHQLSVLDTVRRFADQGASVLIILHDLNLAARYCDQLILLGEGGVQASGSPEQVLQPVPLHRVFGVDVLVQRHPVRGHPLIIAR
ncbi:heme ABC transporter ATP-binding protein [Halopseudomonas bauzanensis]|uniref:heme ABC transporter ATP-binding protein n=1 Tax=Halopseudomonas bauzanensis TaxID=653930 RepID=UPI002556EFBE|nr:heme ABC transporter ATP-binding protein [Halopseudomonas bauzanensis]